MSLILDALRKSEAERRRGELPALVLELPPADARETRLPAWWLLAPLAVLAVAAATWQWRDGATGDTGTAAAAATMATRPEPIQVPAADPLPERTLPVLALPDAGRPDPGRPGIAVASTPVSAAPAPAKASTPTDPAASEPALLSLADLGAEERRALPPLKLTMHLWAEDPARRFVILDGHRLGEGGRAGGVVVDRITEDGVILAADGRRIRLPLP